LGPFGVFLDGKPVSGFVSDKVRALLAYLVTESDRAHRRETLAGLLWPNVPEALARNSLRTALVNLRSMIGDRTADPPLLHISRTSLQFNSNSDAWCDAMAFSQLVRCSSGPLPETEHIPSLEQAAELYRGGFLEGLSMADSVAFEHWALITREQLQRQLLETLYRLAAFHEQRSDYAKALPLVWRQVELEPWREEAQRQLLRVLASSGQRGAALTQYEALQRLLADELGIEPEAPTKALYEHIRTAPEAIVLPSGTERSDATAILHNLPARNTPSIGRERELSQLAARITAPETRLITVSGPGGMGKTHLALETARRLFTNLASFQAAQANFPAGAWLVELAPVDDPGEVPLAVASALGARPLPGRELADIIVDSLQTRELLLILDNCEHLLEAVARLVSRLISHCPQLTVLATSREALRIPGEHIIEVPPMAVSLPGTNSVLAEADAEGLMGLDAVRLFAMRAAAVRPGFSVDEANAAQVAQICRRLDGMPLAIELAAARLRTLSLRDVAARLDDRFALLDRGSRVAEPRQQTLRDTVAWSYELLNQQEQTLFDRLSVFRGGFTLRAAEGVCIGSGVLEGTVLDLLSDLIDKSMVAMRLTGTRDRPQAGGDETRYELLETMRQYAAERLAERGEDGAISARHARYYADLAEQVEPQLHAWDDWVTPIGRLNAEVDNLATAVRWSLATDQPEIALRISGALREWYWTHPYGQQFHVWTRAALKADTDVAPQYRAKALNTLSMSAWGKGDTDLGQKLAGEAVLLAGQAEDHKVMLRALYELGRAMYNAGQRERAAALFEQSRDISLEYGHHIGAIEASTWLAFL